MEACCGESRLFVNHRLTGVRIGRGPRGSEVGGASFVLGRGRTGVEDRLGNQEGSGRGQHSELGSLFYENELSQGGLTHL